MGRPKIDTDVDFNSTLSKRQMQNVIATLQGEYEVKLKPIDDKRSKPQNRFFWRVICQTLAEWFTHQGQPMTKDQAKAILCETYLPESFTNPFTGEVKTTGGSTSGLTVPEFSELLENCIAGLAEYGIELPPPPVVSEQPRGAEGRRRTRHQPEPAM